LVLDCEGLAKLVTKDQAVTTWVTAAHEEDMRVVTSSMTLVEAWHPGITRARFAWTVSRVSVEPVTLEVARAASRLLADAGLHGHKHAIDAALCATALRLPGPAVVLTSDPDDILALGQGRLRAVKV
jgi:hypothetical protein